MTSSLTIITYHYVRDLAASPYPAIKGRTVEDFQGQLDYLERHGRLVGAPDVLAAAAGEEPLPDGAVWLTFDDGLADHYRTVFPILRERGITGVFAAPVLPLTEGGVLDVHKIHFILAVSPDPQVLQARLLEMVATARADFDLESDGYYLSHYEKAGRYDPPAVAFVKRMLQKGLPAGLRSRIADALFRDVVTGDEAGFAADLYLTAENLREMAASGMTIAGHGASHRWLDALDDQEQTREIDATVGFLAGLGVSIEPWIMCYPHGGYDARLKAELARRGCRLGLTVERGIADLDGGDLLGLPRLDTNDLPTSGAADLGAWTRHGGGRQKA